MAQEDGADEEEIKKLKGEVYDAAEDVKEARIKSGFYDRHSSNIGTGWSSVDSPVLKEFTGLEKEVVFVLQFPGRRNRGRWRWRTFT
jgi:hypothetical protein